MGLSRLTNDEKIVVKLSSGFNRTRICYAISEISTVIKKSAEEVKIILRRALQKLCDFLFEVDYVELYEEIASVSKLVLRIN